jgi:hypothetical protein
LTAIATTVLYRSGTLINHSDVISSRVVPPAVILHPVDALRAGAEDGDVLHVDAGGRQMGLLVEVGGAAAVQGLALLRGVRLPLGRATLQILDVEKREVEVEAQAALAG